MQEDILEVLFSKEQLAARVKELAADIDRDYEGKELVIIGVLRGSVIFVSDLVREMEHKLVLDFLAVSSYGRGTTTSGQVRILKDLSEQIEGKHVIVVEDILDTGNTLAYLSDMLQARQPASVKICTLLDKPSRRTADISADYVGFTVPDAFVVGYGLDYSEYYRNLPYIGILKPEVYTH